MRNKIDMLNGSLWDKILLFVLPLAATTMLQQLFNAADVAVVGQFVGKDAMAAVGSNSAVIGLIVNLFNGIALGANVVIARMIGHGDKEQITVTIHTSIIFSVVTGLLMAVIAEFLAEPVVVALGVPDEVYDMAVLYLKIYLIGLPFIFLYNFESAIYRGRGDTRTPLICLLFSGAVNVGLNLVFVIYLGMSVAGVAIATLISSALSCVMLFVLLMRRDDEFKVSFKNMRINWGILGKIVRIGLPAGIQSSMFSLANIIIQSAVNSLGADVMAASSAAFNIEIMAYYIVNAFGQATTTFIGQNYGAGNIKRCREVLKTSYGMALIVTALFSILILFTGRYLLAVFNPEPEVIELGMIRLIAIVGFEVLNLTVDSFSGALRGYGRSTMPAILSLVGICIFRVVWVMTAFAAYPNFAVLMAVYPISWIITSAMIIINYLFVVRKVMRGKDLDVL